LWGKMASCVAIGKRRSSSAYTGPGRPIGNRPQINNLPHIKLLLALPLVCAGAFAQTQHVAWSLDVTPNPAAPGGKALVRVAAKLDSGWHLYSGSSAAGIPTSFQLAPPGAAVEKLRMLQPQPKRAYDANFGVETETYESDVAFLLELQLKKDAPAGSADYTLNAKYQVCNATECDPGHWSGPLALNIAAGAAAGAPAIPAGYTEVKPRAAGVGNSDDGASGSLAGFVLLAFGFGLASIFTPCVFPMIPITMSYFMNKQGSVSQAVTFCLGIIVLFSGIGLVVTAALGPVGVVALGQSAWVNGFIAVLFVVFGLSLLGAFEITIPSSILTRLNQSSQSGGLIGTLLMGLTFALASFACVGPFMGALLAGSISGGSLRPLVGMVAFATGLALPFFLLALFPSYLKRLPRSGGWLARVKVVMGFIILAWSLKYLSSVDQVLQWNALTRERFLAIWIVLFASAGLYLLGFLRLEGIKPDDSMGLGRLLCGMAFVAFALTLAPGMGGGKLGELDAYVPLANGNLSWMENQYREALDRARREGKLVLVNFTGYACTNCHWMKANMFTRPEIESAMQKFVLVELFSDAGDATSDANQKLELTKFNTVAEPFYAIMAPDESVVTTFPGLTRDPAVFAAFLRKGDAAPVPPAAAAAAGTLPQFAKLGGGIVDPNGKVTVIDFWATYCVPCIREIPSFNLIDKEYGAKGVLVVGVAMDENPSIVPPFLKKHPMEYQVALGTQAMFQQYSLEGLPVTLVFDKSGKQVKRFEKQVIKDADLKAAVQAAM
jgi:thiol:disulfide interchange protein